MKKTTIMKVAILCVIGALLCAGVVGHLLYSPVRKTIQAIEEFDCTQAEHYRPKLKFGLRASMFSRAVPKALDAVISDYNLGNASYDDVTAVFTTVRSLSPEIDTSYFEDLLQKLTQSKEAFSQGREAMEVKKYLLAIEHYEKVIPEDVLYQTAASNINNATTEYIQQTKTTFYRYIANNHVSQAEKCLQDALENISNSELTKMQDKLAKGVYGRLTTLLNNQNVWARRTLNSGRDITYYCYSIATAKNDNNAFLCIYVPEHALSMAESATRYSGPGVWYRIQGSRIIELDYEQSKNLESSGTRRWNRNSSLEEKAEFLENVFG